MSEQAVLSVQGMSCQHCVKTIKTKVSELSGVKGVEVDLAGAKAKIDYEPRQTSVSQIIAAIEDEGYEASLVT